MYMRRRFLKTRCCPKNPPPNRRFYPDHFDKLVTDLGVDLGSTWVLPRLYLGFTWLRHRPPCKTAARYGIVDRPNP